jgi:hypothetical protein
MAQRIAWANVEQPEICSNCSVSQTRIAEIARIRATRANS